MKILAAVDDSSFASFVVKDLSLRKWPDDSIIKLATVINTNENLHSASVLGTQQNLADIANYLARIHTNVKFQPEIYQGTDASAELLKQASEWHAELLVVAAHGKGAIERILLGSTSEALIERSKTPVIIAKEGPLQQDSINILVPIDNSPFSLKSMEWFLKQRWTKPVNVKLMTVVHPISEQYSLEADTKKAVDILRQHQHMKDEVMATIQQWEAHIHPHIGPVRLKFQISEGIPQNEILAEAEEWPANLIVMGSHGHTGLKRYLIGSVARAVAQNANCSVEVVRLPDFEDYYRNWKSFDATTHLEDLKRQGRYDMPHMIGGVW